MQTQRDKVTRFTAVSHRESRRLIAGILGLILTVGAALYGGETVAQSSIGLTNPPTLASGIGDSSGFAGLSPPDFLPVEEAYPLAVEAVDDRSLRAIWQMPAGYYLYQHAFKFRLERDGAELPVQFEYPPALQREDEYFGRVQVYYDSVELELTASGTLNGTQLTITSQGCADAGLCYPPRTQTFRIDADGTVAEIAPAQRAPRPAGESEQAGASGSLWLMLVFAFAGGLILNLMPCVLPVLSLKVLGFASAAPAERRRHGLLYSAGVLLSFLVVAMLLISLRSAGQAIGWGFQLQSPGVVLALAYLFVVLGLAMSGTFELGNRFMNLGSGLADRGGAAGSFFTGVLAVVVASPCTAPFMGTALGYALIQPAATGLTVFAALGAGMATPMLLLSFSEAARRRMPQPGPWMDRLKQALAFPLYATALWLFWVAGRQTSVDVMAAALLGALLLALALWLWRGAVAARVASVACVLAALFLAAWRPPAGVGVEATLPSGAIAYSPAHLEELRAAGQPVFVDVTADWCITCLANERAVLGTDAVQRAFRSAGVAYMVADWTDYDPTIADFVSSHGRSGIPLYVLYNGAEAPHLLPQLLRQNTVLEALNALNRVSVAAAER